MPPYVLVLVFEPRVTEKFQGVRTTERRAKYVAVLIRKYRLACVKMRRT